MQAQPFDVGNDPAFDPELEESLAAWEEVDRHAVAVLREALPQRRGVPSPLADLGAAAAHLRAGIDRADTHRTAFAILATPWQALGLTDWDERLTAWGDWPLPRAVAGAWDGDFDAG